TPPPHAWRTACLVAASTPSWNSQKRSQVTAVSKVSLISPSRTRPSRTYPPRRNEARQTAAGSLSPPRISPRWLAQISSARASHGGRQPPGLEHAARRHHADGLHELVDMGVQRRVVAARARRYPPAQRRPLERLREVPQGQAVRLQLGFQRRAKCARRDPRGP